MSFLAKVDRVNNIRFCKFNDCISTLVQPSSNGRGGRREQLLTIPDTPVDTAKAESIYKSCCMPCHGDEYQGALGPALNQVGTTLGREKIYKQIVYDGGGMPGYEDQLTEEEIFNLTN